MAAPEPLYLVFPADALPSNITVAAVADEISDLLVDIATAIRRNSLTEGRAVVAQLVFNGRSLEISSEESAADATMAYLVGLLNASYANEVQLRTQIEELQTQICEVAESEDAPAVDRDEPCPYAERGFWCDCFICKPRD